MKHTILPTALALALTASLAFAQTPTPAPDPQAAPQTTPAPIARPQHAPDPQRETKRLTKALNLTPDQAAKLEPILADRDQKLAALRANDSLAPKDLHKQLHAVQKSTEEQFAAVLTPDQLQQLKTLRQRRPGAGQAQLPTPPPAA